MRIATIASITMALPAAALAVRSPLATPDDYAFTAPANGDFVRGEVMGPDPAPYSPVRGEDQIYVYEALSEIEAARDGGAGSWPRQGIDRRWPRQSASRVGTAFALLYQALAANTNGSGAGGIALAGVPVPGAASAAWFVRSGRDPTGYARASVLEAGAAAVPVDGMDALGRGTGRLPLAATNVAAFYRCLASVGGVAGDYAVTSSGSATNLGSSVSEWTDCSFSADADGGGSFEYTTRRDVSGYRRIGGGLQESTSQETSVRQVAHGGKDVRSAPMRSSTISSFDHDEAISVTLFTNAVARASGLSVRSAWVVCHCYYADSLQRWVSPSNAVLDVNVATNAMVALACSAATSEEGGMVVAKATPHYMDAYNAFFAAMPDDTHHPDDLWFPAAPGAEAFAPGEAKTVANGRYTAISISPVRLALVVDVDWHAGFHKLGDRQGD